MDTSASGFWERRRNRLERLLKRKIASETGGVLYREEPLFFERDVESDAAEVFDGKTAEISYHCGKVDCFFCNW